MPRSALPALLFAFSIACSILALPQEATPQEATPHEATVRGTVNVARTSPTESGSADVVVWLTNPHATLPVAPGPTVQLAQKNKRFVPHFLAVTSGTEIEFPNHDPFFHNVFSIYRGKPFDLGLYESGAARKIHFTRPGVSYIFCNIHPEMSATVLVLNTNFFAITQRDGTFQITHIPPGRYKMEVWYEFASEPELAALTRELEITPGDNPLNKITLHSSLPQRDHLNKYGEPYPPIKTDTY